MNLDSPYLTAERERLRGETEFDRRRGVENSTT